MDRCAIRPRSSWFPVAWLALIVAAISCGSESVTDDTPLFVETALDAGIDFDHEHGGTGRYYYVEIMAGGGAWIDFDGDGDLDLYAVQGQNLGNAPPTLTDRIYRNLGATPGERVPRFEDATEELGLEMTGYGLGAAAGDFDNDGWTDLYVTQLGSNVLLRNDSGQGFEDVSAAAGVTGNELSSSAAFVDLDGDGWLDLYVTNYLRYRLESDKICTDMVGLPEYCGPQSYEPERDRLYRNRGDGTFEDVTRSAGIDVRGPGLGVVTADFDRDGRLDIYVANDQAANHLWMNLGDFRFREEGMIRGAAVDRNGKVEASMGVEVADLDADGDEDLFMTHLIGETNTLYLNDGSGYFADVSLGSALGQKSLRWTGFGCALFDADRDGRLDLFVANGAVRADPTQRSQGDPLPYREPNLLFLNTGDGEFHDVSHRLLDSGVDQVSRAAAPGDVDDDGDLDLAVFNIGGPLQLYLNETSNENHWIGLRLLDSNGRDAQGAEVRWSDLEGRTFLRRVSSTAGYLSARDPRLLIGLGSADIPVDLDVRWTDGSREFWQQLGVDRYHELVQGEGTAP
ncbi:MAG: CRTAC1 family protein [Thermoanaerobaculia bacterium]|nr:CRTAC1 family protein [Thermoanaerobaculia bacterium]